MSSDSNVYLAFDSPGGEKETDAAHDITKAQKWLRRLVISYNVFFWVTGPGIVGLGIWFYIALSEYEPVVIRLDFAGPAYIIILGGATSIIAGILGCLGGVNEHRRLLLAYFSLMFIVCCLEISATVYMFKLYDESEQIVRSSFTAALEEYYVETTDTVDYIHNKFSCCGVDGPSDWQGLNDTSTPSQFISELPSSCYETNVIKADITAREDAFFSEGCLQDMVAWARRLFVITGWTIFSMACTQLLALGVICCFAKAVTFRFF